MTDGQYTFSRLYSNIKASANGWQAAVRFWSLYSQACWVRTRHVRLVMTRQSSILIVSRNTVWAEIRGSLLLP